MLIILSVVLVFPAIFLWESDRFASWLCIGMIILLLTTRYNIKQDTKAYINRRNWWAKGGPDADK